MINAYKTDSIVIKRTTYDQWGEPTTASESIMGKVEQKTKLVRSLSGEEVTSSASVLVGNIDVEHDDRIVFGGKEYSIINIERVADFSTICKRVYLQ